ncbi:MAG: hypothetical protein DRR06_01505 [Gammaproteobacteria bacterium]|nr:MAG: hypothetical protein DRR06_01505 [Gammaproteobacteria bacterium]
MSELNGLDVIVLRSPRDDDPLAAAIVALGGQVHQLPVQRIVPLADDDTQIDAQIKRISTYDKAIFVSRNATALALRWLDRSCLSLPFKMQCFTVGPTSAQLLGQRHIQVVYPPRQSTSEGLLMLPALQEVYGQNIIVFRGVGGRPLLGDTLAERGAQVDYCELYQRQPDRQWKKKLLELLGADEHPPVLVAHSGGILDALLTVVGTEQTKSVLTIPTVVPGQRLREYARKTGFQQVITAKSALAEDMERAVVDWYTQKPAPGR